MTIRIFGGGTMTHVLSHLSLCAPAKGKTAKFLHSALTERGIPNTVHLTSFADSDSLLDTNDDVEAELIRVLAMPETSAIVFSVALCDVEGEVNSIPADKYGKRLQTRTMAETPVVMQLHPTKKLLGLVRELRPDVYSVGFKTTTDESVSTQIERARVMGASHRLDLILANDVVTRSNLVLRGPGPGPLDPAYTPEVLYCGMSRPAALEHILARLPKGGHGH